MRGIKIFLILVIVSVVGASAWLLYEENVPGGLHPEMIPEIKVELGKMTKLMLSGNYDGALAYMPKRLINKVGGKDLVGEGVVRIMAAAADREFVIEKYEAGEPGIPQGMGSLIVSLVPIHAVIKSPLGRFHQDTFYLAISDDGGKTWSFGSNPDQAHQWVFFDLYPELIGRFKFPEYKPLERE